MSKSIKNILIVLGIAILIPIIFIIIICSSLEINIIEELNKGISKFTNDTVLKIGNDGIIEVTETINFKIGRTQTELPKFYLTLDDNSWSSKEGKGKTFDVEISLDGIKMEEADYRIYDEIKDRHDYIKLLNYDFSNHNERTLIIKHKYYVSQFVEEYNNVTVINLNDETEYREHSIKIIIPKSTSNFILQDDFGIYGNVAKKVDETTYIINRNRINSIRDLELLLDRGIINYCDYKNEEYHIATSYNNDTEGSYELMDIVSKLLVVSIICLVIVISIRWRNKVPKEYVRDTSMVIDPILAEAIIDRKVGVKELIMSCVANRINKGNIECIDNDTIKLLNYENVPDYERRIIDLLFKNIDDTITFEEIKNMFKKSNDKTRDFYNNLKQIKKDIEKELVDRNIYENKGELLLKFIRVISIMLFANIIFVICVITLNHGIIMPYHILWTNIIALIIGIVKEFGLNLNNNFNKNTNLKLSLLLYGPIILLIIINSIVHSFNTYKEVYIFILVILIINIFLRIKANTHLFTKKGKEEYKKAYGLKSYIEDYSLMKDRELESTILWDDYLTYAIAFGISNKVTDRFGEEFMKANITLQNIDKFLRF